jgi:hypothetical protein
VSASRGVWFFKEARDEQKPFQFGRQFCLFGMSLAISTNHWILLLEESRPPSLHLMKKTNMKTMISE